MVGDGTKTNNTSILTSLEKEGRGEGGRGVHNMSGVKIIALSYLLSWDMSWGGARGGGVWHDAMV